MEKKVEKNPARRILFYFILSFALLFFCPFFVWFFAIPDNLIKDYIENSISSNGSSKVKASIEELKKGFFFTVYIDSLDIEIDKHPAVRIKNILSRVNPLYLSKKQLALSIKGEIGKGTINGYFKFPIQPQANPMSRKGGSINIDNIEITAISYLTSMGVKGDGLISGNINLKNTTTDIIFKISDANIQNSVIKIPLPLSLFHKIQGTFSISGNTIKVNSISLDGEKGYARLQGNITNGFMDLTLELMPIADKLTPLESMIIEKYQISPGYYIIPIEGHFPLL